MARAMTSRLVVAPLSRAAIEAAAAQVRAALGIASTQRIDMLRMIELVLPRHLPNFSWEIVEDRELGDAEATTSTVARHIKIGQRCYDGALAGVERYLFTLAHELGHLLLHTGKPSSLARGSVKAYVDPEWQADAFAAAFIAPAEMVQSCSCQSELMRRSGLSRPAAEIRCKTLNIPLPFLPVAFGGLRPMA